MVRTGAITLTAVPFQLSQGKLRAILYFSGKLSESQWSKLSVNLYEKNLSLYYLMVTILIHYPVSSHFSYTDIAQPRYLFLRLVASSLEKPLLAGYTYMCLSQGLQLNEIRLFLLFTYQCRQKLQNHITYREKNMK